MSTVKVSESQNQHPCSFQCYRGWFPIMAEENLWLSKFGHDRYPIKTRADKQTVSDEMPLSPLSSNCNPHPCLKLQLAKAYDGTAAVKNHPQFHYR